MTLTEAILHIEEILPNIKDRDIYENHVQLRKWLIELLFRINVERDSINDSLEEEIRNLESDIDNISCESCKQDHLQILSWLNQLSQERSHIGITRYHIQELDTLFNHQYEIDIEGNISNQDLRNT